MMKAREAVEYAKEHSAKFRNYISRAEVGMERGSYNFTIGNESFYARYDGWDWHYGKHNADRSRELIQSGAITERFEVDVQA